MKVIGTNEKENLKYYQKIYDFDNTVQLDSLIEIIKQFENDEVKFFECNCSTFDENGSTMYRTYGNLEEIKKIENLPSPYVSFDIHFVNRETRGYQFSLSTSTNSNYLYYEIDKERLNKVLG